MQARPAGGKGERLDSLEAFVSRAEGWVSRADERIKEAEAALELARQEKQSLQHELDEGRARLAQMRADLARRSITDNPVLMRLVCQMWGWPTLLECLADKQILTLVQASPAVRDTISQSHRFSHDTAGFRHCSFPLRFPELSLIGTRLHSSIILSSAHDVKRWRDICVTFKEVFDGSESENGFQPLGPVFLHKFNFAHEEIKLMFINHHCVRLPCISDSMPLSLTKHGDCSLQIELSLRFVCTDEESMEYGCLLHDAQVLPEDAQVEVGGLLFLLRLRSSETGEEIDIRNVGDGVRPKVHVAMLSPTSSENAWPDELRPLNMMELGAPYSLRAEETEYSSIVRALKDGLPLPVFVSMME